MRRKKKAVHKTTASSDDKKLGSTLKKMGVTNIPAIEEVNLFKQNGQVESFQLLVSLRPSLQVPNRPQKYLV